MPIALSSNSAWLCILSLNFGTVHRCRFYALSTHLDFGISDSDPLQGLMCANSFFQTQRDSIYVLRHQPRHMETGCKVPKIVFLKIQTPGSMYCYPLQKSWDVFQFTATFQDHCTTTYLVENIVVHVSALVCNILKQFSCGLVCRPILCHILELEIRSDMERVGEPGPGPRRLVLQ